MSNEDINIILNRCFIGELYDITFTTEGNIFGELKNEQRGNTLTLEKLLTEFFFIEETSDDDKTSKRILRTKFLLACYYEKNDLKILFEKFTTYLNGGTNTNSAFIINVSGGNLVILFAYLIIDIKNKVVPQNLIDYFTPHLINDSDLEINDTIIDLANEVVTPSKSVVFSDLDFYIIKNMNYTETTQSGGAPEDEDKRKLDDINTEPDPVRPAPTLRRSIRSRPRTITLLEEIGAEHDRLIEELRVKRQSREEQKKKEELQRRNERTNEEKAAAIKKNKIENDVQDLTQKIQTTKKKNLSTQIKQGFCVHRIKTQACLEDYLDLVLEDWHYIDKEEPEPLKEFKDTLLDFFNFYVDNPNYSVSEANTYITREEYKLLHKNGLPDTIGYIIKIYPQLFQEKFLNTKGLSSNCIMHLNNLKIQKKIIEAAKNLNIYLLIESLNIKYKLKDNYNLMLFLNELCFNINVMLKDLSTGYDENIFQSLTTLKKPLVNEIIKKIENVLYNHEITKALETKLKELLTYNKSETIYHPRIFLKKSRTYIESDPQIDKQMQDTIKDGIFFYYNDTVEEFSDEDVVVVEAGAGGKKLKKSKKKRNVYKKTRKKHNKKINIENSYSNKKLIKNKKTRKKNNKKKRETIKEIKKIT